MLTSVSEPTSQCDTVSLYGKNVVRGKQKVTSNQIKVRWRGNIITIITNCKNKVFSNLAYITQFAKTLCEWPQRQSRCLHVPGVLRYLKRPIKRLHDQGSHTFLRMKFTDFLLIPKSFLLTIFVTFIIIERVPPSPYNRPFHQLIVSPERVLQWATLKMYHSPKMYHVPHKISSCSFNNKHFCTKMIHKIEQLFIHLFQHWYENFVHYI